ncbi:GntR family transcriptional regulator [Mesorhizobium sp. WSM4887]|uniref:GntR family transcriptional regulator n=1 Tax=Mesorhizobium sp. WSM4887 TaxID=3038543 RepID=UPI002415F3A1|nr:GntR family transcriptional regulator [Mesorhizobium sp. WSM4887]MDG4889811.1 GntR family transcriptional regulator [Mesorhizobium sp. WSM4887]
MARPSGQTQHRLANQILNLIRDAKFEPGHRLREQHLADLLGLSRTPVRSALALLSSLGIVEARKNIGFVLVKPFDALQRVEIEIPASADQRLYETLIRDRLAGSLPDSLTQTDIAQRYGVDRVVMLRTLMRLAEDGLVARNKGHGWTFLPTLDSKLALHSSYEFRSTIEPAIFLLSTFKSDPALLDRARMQHMYLLSHPDVDALDAAVIFDTDASFHEMFAEFSGNAFFLQAVQQQNRLRRTLEFGGYHNRRRMRDWCKEHLSIIDAVVIGDLDRASEVMRTHLQNASETMLAIRGISETRTSRNR